MMGLGFPAHTPCPLDTLQHCLRAGMNHTPTNISNPKEAGVQAPSTLGIPNTWNQADGIPTLPAKDQELCCFSLA